MYRAVFESHISNETAAAGALAEIEAFRGALVEAESRTRWDRLVESASTLEVLDTNTRLVHTKYRLGWPSSPRDSITIQRHYIDDDSLLLVSTSIPQSNHDPAYLRSLPPYVRAHISMNAWHVQIVEDAIEDIASLVQLPGKRLRITTFSSFDARGSWAVGSNLSQQLPVNLRHLKEYILGGQSISPSLCFHAPHISIDHLLFDPVRNLITMDYSVVRNADQEDHDEAAVLVFKVSGQFSWDVEVASRAVILPSESLGVKLEAGNRGIEDGSTLFIKIVNPQDNDYVKRYKVSIERTMGKPMTVRFGGVIQPLDNDLHVSVMQLSPTSLLGDSASTLSELSLQPTIMMDTMTPVASRTPSIAPKSSERDNGVQTPPVHAVPTPSKRTGSRNRSHEKALAAAIERNYIRR